MYEVSDSGKVRSWKKGSRWGGKRKTPKILKSHINACGYRVHRLSQINKNTANISLHRLIAKAFISNPKELPCVNHKNGIKTDNRIENLEWCTYSQNSRHAYKNGLSVQPDNRGDNHGMTKLKNNQVKAIKELLKHAKHGDQKKIAALYDVSEHVISGIKSGKSWSHI